ncbi:hypothetical protein M0657_011571 [Pyricularia oryzae]|nr:hypothetical protein M9X92_011815 [Pyricularia oryzae]KAI7910008.1 hypothetical protein M0657_011571 [Pyricularia oryzae]
MSFRVKERENGIKRYEGHIKASFEDSVVNQVIRTPFLKRSSTSNDNSTQTRDFVNHFQDSLSPLSRLREPVFTITNTPNKAPELKYKSGGETASRLLRFTAHRHRNQPGRRAGHKTVPAVFINKKLVCQSCKQLKKWPTSTRKTSMPTAPKSASVPHQPLTLLTTHHKTSLPHPPTRALCHGSAKTPWRGPELHLQL